MIEKDCVLCELQIGILKITSSYCILCEVLAKAKETLDLKQQLRQDMVSVSYKFSLKKRLAI
jgi:hypothetical protein